MPRQANLVQAPKGAAPVSRVQSLPIRFNAIPDTGTTNAKLGSSGLPVATLPNRLDIASSIAKIIAAEASEFWFPAPATAQMRNAPWVLNTCADADEYLKALIWLDETLDPQVPIFNHPRAIALTRRDHSSRLLAGVDGLVVPKCVRFTASSPASFDQCFARNGFSYPVLVRPCRGQTGEGQVRVDGPEDWQHVVHSQWFGQPHFMTEFVDFATSAGEYLKARVLFVGKDVFIRHVKGATFWSVHNNSAASLRNFDGREMGLIDELGKNETFRKLCLEIPNRTGLDFCGMDIGVDVATDRFVLFECNAAMSVFFAGKRDRRPLRPGQGSERDASARAERAAALETPAEMAFAALLAAPARWRWAPGGQKAHPDVPPCRVLLAEPDPTLATPSG